MAVTRLNIVKKFIDYLTQEYDKEVYNTLRSEYSYTPKEIAARWEWRNRNSYKTCQSSEAYVTEEAFLESVMWDFSRANKHTDEIYERNHGAEQIVFIFQDEVYKISSNDVGANTNYLIDGLEDRFKELFAPYIYEDYYKGCYIYSQEKVAEIGSLGSYSQAIKQDINLDAVEYDCIYSDDCLAAIALKYGIQFLEDFCENLYSIGYELDIHNENFGLTTEGKIKIFDPIYEAD